MRDIVLVYMTKSGNTRLIAEAIAQGVRSMDLDAAAVELCDVNVEEILKAKVVAIGSPTYEQRMLPPIEKLINSFDRNECEGKLGVAFGSYGWSGEAPLMIAKRMRELGFQVLDPVMRVQYRPTDKEIEACKLLGKGIALKLKRSQAKILR
jgi:flavorubredoxin